MNVAQTYATELREYAPIEYAGLWFYPLEVRHFALYQSAKPAMELLQASLPIRLARLSWAECLAEMDAAARAEGLPYTGFLTSFLHLLSVALKIDAVKEPERLLIVSDRETKRFKAVAVCQKEQPVILNTKQLHDVRQILAEQNGYEIPGENWNPELVRAQQHLQQRNGGNGGTLDDLVASVAAAMGRRTSEVWGWSLREFKSIDEAINRRILFQLYATAELSHAVKFKNGNPVPTWRYSSKGDLPAGFKSLKDLEAGSKGLLASKK